MVTWRALSHSSPHALPIESTGTPDFSSFWFPNFLPPWPGFRYRLLSPSLLDKWLEALLCSLTLGGPTALSQDWLSTLLPWSMQGILGTDTACAHQPAVFSLAGRALNIPPVPSSSDQDERLSYWEHMKKNPNNWSNDSSTEILNLVLIILIFKSR